MRWRHHCGRARLLALIAHHPPPLVWRGVERGVEEGRGRLAHPRPLAVGFGGDEADLLVLEEPAQVAG
jgi:hypothetical protein